MFLLLRGRTKALIAALAAAMLASCAAPPAENEVTLNFFQFKPEAVQEFSALIDEFEPRIPASGWCRTTSRTRTPPSGPSL